MQLLLYYHKKMEEIRMKKKNIMGIIVIAILVIGIVAALVIYKKEQAIPEKTETGEEEDTIILSADENPFGMEIKKINENYDLTKNYYKNYDNTGLQKFEITAIYTNATDFIKEIRGATEYCQYIYLDEKKNIIIELNEKQKEKWIKKAEENISNELEQTDEDELYKISVSDDYTEVNCQVAQKANGLTFTAKLMIIFFNSEMYQILNGNAEWSIHVVAKDLSTGGELVNIYYPKEVFSITEET